MKRRFSTSRSQGRLTHRPNSFRPAFDKLEDRCVPTGTPWAIEADPEGYVFHDINGNGAFDTGEPSMGAGLTVYVDANENGVLDAGETSTTTDATGHYSIILPDGTYSIRVIAPAGFVDDSRPFGTLIKDFPSVENGINPDGSNSYSGLAWANGSLYVTFTRSTGNNTDNVMYQVDPTTGIALGPPTSIPGEVGEITFDGTNFWGADPVHDVMIRFDSAGRELQRLSFAGMDVNSIEWDGAALRVLDNSARRIYQIDPTGAGTVLGYINAPNENIGGLAFDGTTLWVNGRDTDRVYALDPTTGAIQRSFAAPADLAYGLAVHGTDLWLSDNATSRVFRYDLGYGGGRIVTVAGDDVTGVNLAVFQLGSISGRVFNDNNQNGIQDSNDGGLSGWRAYIDANANGKYDTWETSAVTDALGNYTIGNLRPAPYTVALDIAGQQLTRWSQVAPVGGSYSISLNSGDTISGENFANYLDRSDPQLNEWAPSGNSQLNLYTGVLWTDVLRLTGSAMTYSAAVNYAANSTEGGYDDWRLPSKTEAQAVAQTGYGGRFGYDPSVVTLWWTSTSAGGQKQWAVNLNTGSASSVGTGGTLAATMLRDSGSIVDDGDASYSATGFTSKSTSGAYQNDQSSATSGSGSKTATWTFNNLEVGATYKVAVTWKAVSGAATNSPFRIIDGTSTPTTVVANQQAIPADFSIGSTGWKGLGTFTLKSDTLKVQLSNLANGTVLADAVRIFEVFPSYAPSAPLLAADLPTGTLAAQKLTSGAVKPLLNEAVRRWESLGMNPSALHGIDVRTADLGGSTLGLASGHTITLDDNAAGWGWFVDKTPRSDSEFTTAGNQGEQNHMDLLTVLMHEVGHIIGYEHTMTPGSLMNEALATGTRENPGTGLVTETGFWGSLIAQAQMKKQKSVFGTFLEGSERRL